MKKLALITAALVGLNAYAASADSFNLSIGGPAPVIVQPVTAYAEAPVETIIVGGENHPPEPHHLHRYDWSYWKKHEHAERAHDDRDYR